MTFTYYLWYFILGGIFLSIGGCIANWIERKLTARIQFRVGPPWYQNFADFVKLMGKEVIIPEGANTPIFILSPIISFISVIICGVMAILVQKGIFTLPGDIILFVYFLTIPSLAIILGASASGNVLSAVGLSRELKLLLGYELPFICAIIISAIKAGGTTSLLTILNVQQQTHIFIGSLSGFIGFLISLFVITGKIGIVPFDTAEAETEISSGVFMEYSGILLGLFKLTKYVLLIVGPVFIMTLFLGGFSYSSPIAIIISLLKYILIVFLIVLIKNTNPRLRIDQAMRFFWGHLTFLGIIGIILSFLGW
ncbi:MAG TPA: NADH-quinone oxidoreductase subunit H [bacterium]|nr:NADH-quinone oxidoreductase subunit H [bacterium]